MSSILPGVRFSVKEKLCKQLRRCRLAAVLAARALGPGLPQPNPAWAAIAEQREFWPQRLAPDAAVALKTRDGQLC
jgi:hypothetical protein